MFGFRAVGLVGFGVSGYVIWLWLNWLCVVVAGCLFAGRWVRVCVYCCVGCSLVWVCGLLGFDDVWLLC